jgi:hypothetical protein
LGVRVHKTTPQKKYAVVKSRNDYSMEIRKISTGICSNRQPVQGISLAVTQQINLRAPFAARELPGSAFHVVIHLPDAGKLAGVLSVHKPFHIRRRVSEKQSYFMGEILIIAKPGN